MVIKHNSLCPGVYRLELFQRQVCISTCVNILTSTTAWNSSKLVEKKQMPTATYHLKNKSLGLAAKETITAGVWSKELVYRPHAPAEFHVINPHPFFCTTSHVQISTSVDHGAIFNLQILPNPWPPDAYTAKTFETLTRSYQFLTYLFFLVFSSSPWISAQKDS